MEGIRAPGSDRGACLAGGCNGRGSAADVIPAYRLTSGGAVSLFPCPTPSRSVSNPNVTQGPSGKNVIGVINVMRMLQAAEAGAGEFQLEVIVFQLLCGSRTTQETHQNSTEQDDSQARTPGVCSRKS